MGRCYHTAVLGAPADKVWETIRNFHDMNWAAGVVTKLERVGDVPGDKVGAGRKLNDAFVETLQTFDDAARSFTYSIDDGPGPVGKAVVKNYIGGVRLLPITEGGGTLIEWQSTYGSSDDAAVGDLCNPIYRALLQTLQKHFGA